MNEHATQPAETMANYSDGPNRLERAIEGLSGTDLDLALGGDTRIRRFGCVRSDAMFVELF